MIAPAEVAVALERIVRVESGIMMGERARFGDGDAFGGQDDVEGAFLAGAEAGEFDFVAGKLQFVTPSAQDKVNLSVGARLKSVRAR